MNIVTVMNTTTVSGHITEIAVLAGFLAVMGTFAYIERRRKLNAPKPTGATRV